MAKPTRTTSARTPGPRKPGPRKTSSHTSGPAPHGTTRRRTAHKPSPKPRPKAKAKVKTLKQKPLKKNAVKTSNQKALKGSGAREATKRATADVRRKSGQVTARGATKRATADVRRKSGQVTARGATKRATAEVRRKSGQVTARGATKRATAEVRRKSGQVTASSIPFHRPERDVEPATVAKWWLLAGIVVVVGFVVAVLEAPFFEARSVQVSGVARTSNGAVLDALDVPPDKALIRYDTANAEELLLSLPWVKGVEVTRQWPSTVRVVVRERSAWAALGAPSGSRWLVLGDDGVVVEERLTPPAGVPIIVATEAIMGRASIGEPLSDAERVLDISHDLPLQLAPWVTTWSTDDDGRVTAHLVGSARAEFGAFEDHRTQFVSLASILDGGAPLTCLSTIDLSVADTPVLRRDADCMVAARQLGEN